MPEILELPQPASATNIHSAPACQRSLAGVRDALYVLSGKWKLPLIIALSTGEQRFTDLAHTVEGITPKLLSKELRELEMNEFVLRQVYPTVPVRITYRLTPYAATLNPVIDALANWGTAHKERIQHG